ncbi:hypothetical protein AB0H88_00860 [Nonomuraea sp. NPDC050680]|jgi:hypothetical protein|uniref:hypothetical protein n=1 Tax=Nonomuraea sp. NPDC050680 TaxID=3154630 RepID=UPI0033E805C7
MAKWHGPDGIVVEAIVLGNRPLLRVSRHVNGRAYFRGYCARVEELGGHGVDLAKLVEEPRDGDRPPA